MSFSEFQRSHGITESTPKNLMLGAGTIHKGFKYGYHPLTSKPDNWDTDFENFYTRSGTVGNYTYETVEATTGGDAPNFVSGTYYYKGWNFLESLIGATSGGNKLSIKPEVMTVDADGALVKVKGLDLKTGESAKLETNLIEITPDLLKTTIIGKNSISNIEGYSLIESKSDIQSGDYIEDFAFVGKKTNGEPIIVIFDYVLCTSGLELEGKKKDNSVVKCTFECYQELTKDLSKLPYHIYYKTPTV